MTDNNRTTKIIKRGAVYAERCKHGSGGGVMVINGVDSPRLMQDSRVSYSQNEVHGPYPTRIRQKKGL